MDDGWEVGWEVVCDVIVWGDVSPEGGVPVDSALGKLPLLLTLLLPLLPL